ncbi:OadG family protein [Desulfosporosinus fructosivorans]|nr:OadG family protein [Desulfosporosinus fructosivorans]
MTVAENLHLGFNTTVNGMGIVFLVLIVLWAVIVVQSKLIFYFSEMFKKSKPVDNLPINTDKIEIERNAIIDDETLAVIMAAVSNNADIPLSRLQFNSIKAL